MENTVNLLILSFRINFKLRLNRNYLNIYLLFLYGINCNIALKKFSNGFLDPDISVFFLTIFTCCINYIDCCIKIDFLMIEYLRNDLS